MRFGEQRQRNARPTRRHTEAIAIEHGNGARWSFGAMMALSWALLATVLLGGCVTQSIYPIYSDETLVFESALLGDWVDSSAPADGVMTFSVRDDMGYRVERVCEKGTAVYVAHLARIGEGLFMDLYLKELPGDTDYDMDAFLSVHFVPARLILRVDELGDRLKLSNLDTSWLEKRLKTAPDELNAMDFDGGLLLTDNTERLQEFLAEHADNEDAWCEVFDFRRVDDNER